ncbi:MAG: hypothetical protein HYU97_02280 [Deltaproteobacteria bacterium]|nr:hypothetical protein [Deltaproteobacteria bacterium]
MQNFKKLVARHPEKTLIVTGQIGGATNSPQFADYIWSRSLATAEPCILNWIFLPLSDHVDTLESLLFSRLEFTELSSNQTEISVFRSHDGSPIPNMASIYPNVISAPSQISQKK